MTEPPPGARSSVTEPPPGARNSVTETPPGTSGSVRGSLAEPLEVHYNYGAITNTYSTVVN